MLIFFIVLVLIFIFITRHPLFKINSSANKAIVCFILSSIGGVVTYFLYTSYYSIERSNVDIFKFFDDAALIANYFSDYPKDVLKLFFGIYNSDDPIITQILKDTSHWYRPYHFGEYNDNQIVIRLNLILYFLSGGFYATHALIFNFLGFIGIWFFIKAALLKINIIQLHYLEICFLLPNIWIWTSGILKEPILIFSLGILIFSSVQLIYLKNKIHFVNILVGVFGLVLTKQYVLGAIIPVVLIWIISQKQSLFRSIFMVYTAGLIVFFSLYYLNIFSIPQIIYQKQVDFNNLAQLSNANSHFETFKLSPNPLSILINVPFAIINALFRPFIGEVSKPIMVIAFMENLLVFLMLVYITYALTTFVSSVKKIYWGLLLVCLNLWIIIGLTTTVSGALVRYKIPATIIICILFLITFSIKKKSIEKV